MCTGDLWMRPLDVALVALSLMVLTACTQAPSKSEIRSSIEKCVKAEIPMSWRGPYMVPGGRAESVELIEIQQIGTFDDHSGAVRARVIGTAAITNMFMKKESRPFDHVGEFQFSKDQFGKWSASISVAQ